MSCKLAQAYLHFVGEFVDNSIAAFPLFWASENDVVFVHKDHHLVDVFLGLCVVDKEEVSSDDAIQVEWKVTAVQLTKGDRVVNLLHHKVQDTQGVLEDGGKGKQWSLSTTPCT